MPKLSASFTFAASYRAFVAYVTTLDSLRPLGF
jgi:hypothetical protein